MQRVVSLAARWREQSRELEHQFRLLRDPEAKIRAMALSVAFKNCADDIEAEWAGGEANDRTEPLEPAERRINEGA